VQEILLHRGKETKQTGVLTHVSNARDWPSLTLWQHTMVHSCVICERRSLTH